MASRDGGGRRRSRSVSPDDAPGRAASFEHLQALRNVKLVSQNEYPLPHVQRERLRRREDSDEDANVCMCSHPDKEEIADGDARRCDDVSCLNFATYVECTGSCPAGEYCRNQRLQHPEWFPELEPFKTEKKGYGVRTCEDIAQSSLVGEYVGEIIDQRELARRLKTVPRHELNFYYLLLSPGIYIDARNKGSFTRFVNHSCDPNCKTEKWTVQGETRIAVVALRDIAEGEELTFDYQWKALGSRQITCYCGAPTCKGVIGTEGDVVKDEASRGYFREPTIEEIGAAIIERHIRIFKSPEEQSVYSVAVVTGYNEETDTYEVEYDGAVRGVAVDPSAEDTRETVISLKEVGWQVYCPLDGLSEDQRTKEVFSIPKRRISDVPGTSSAETSPLPPASTPSPSSNAVSASTSISISPSESSGERDVVDQLSVRKQELPVSSKILVKNIPRKYDEAAFRRLFDERKRIDHNGADHSTMLSVDLFFFEDNTGWALVELRSPEDARNYRTKLNNRPLGGLTLRVFNAGNNELDSFRRGKTKALIRQREMSRGTDTSALANDVNGDTKDNVTEERSEPYPYGRKLNWLVSVNEVEESASQRAGMSAALEESLRTKFVKGILHIAKRLHLDRGDATSAILALHRYFTFHPMPTNVEYHAAAMLNLFLKAHSRKVSWTDFVNEVYNEKYRSSQSDEKLSPDSNNFLAQERHLVAAETDLLDGLCFDLSGEDPYALLDVLTTAKNRKKSADSANVLTALSTPIPPTDVQREAKHLIAETLRLRVWMHLPVECVVLSVVYLGAAVVEAMKLRSVSSSELSFPPTPDYLPRLDPFTNSLETVMLLDSASTICTSLKDRWARLETQRSATEAKTTSGDEFDTERFAVSRDKPVSVIELITRLLKAWISIPSASGSTTASPISSSEKSGNFITFGILGSSLGTRWLNSRDPKASPASATNTESVLAATIFRKKAVTRTPATGGGASGAAVKLAAPTVDRLHTTEITSVESIRKLTYLGDASQDCGSLLAGQKLYLQPWPYREEESTFSENHGIESAAARELSAAITLQSAFPDKFVKLNGIVFPEEPKEQRQPSADGDVDMEMADLLVASATAVAATDVNGSVLSATLDRLNHKKHYLAFEQPLHIYSGIFEARVALPLRLRKKVIFDMLVALAALHDRNYVHRFVAPSHLFVYKHGVKLGGYHSVRKTTTVKDKESSVSSGSTAYTMSESERKEQCYGSWLYVTAPEVLLGETLYTWRSDMWAAGCVVLAILLDRVPFLQGQDVRVQLDLIFRLCGTPSSSWEEGAKLRLFRSFKPKHEYKMRVRKTMLEQKNKFPEFPEDAVDLLEALLQLDPSKRSSAKKVLAMPFFDDVRYEEEQAAAAGTKGAFDFSSLPPTFPMQKKKLLQHLKSKRRHTSSLSSSHRSKSSKGSSGTGTGGASSGSNSEKSGHRHRSKRTLSIDKDGGEASDRSARRAKKRGKDGDVKLAGGDDDVPLPASFQFSALSVGEEGGNSSGSGGERAAAAPPKREKLGWGMGLLSSRSDEPMDLAKGG